MDKVENYAEDIQNHLEAKKLTRKQLESIVGKLSFAASVVPERPFLFCLTKRIYSVKQPWHWAKMTREMRRDLETWLFFLKNHNGITLFRSLQVTPSDAINMASDVSDQGFGAFYGSQ